MSQSTFSLEIPSVRDPASVFWSESSEVEKKKKVRNTLESTSEARGLEKKRGIACMHTAGMTSFGAGYWISTRTLGLVTGMMSQFFLQITRSLRVTRA